MELAVITLSILLGLAIVGMAYIVIVNLKISTKEREKLEQLVKAKTLEEFVQYDEDREDEEEETEEDKYVAIEEIGDYVNKKQE